MTGVDSRRLREPLWQAPSGVRALMTTRGIAVEGDCYSGFNLGDHVGDDPVQVQANRDALVSIAKLPEAPRWLSQVHGTTVVEADDVTGPVEADASYSRSTGVVCVVMSADCLPLLIADPASHTVAAVHCGWRSLSSGIIDSLFDTAALDPGSVVATCGPAIGAAVYEVGEEVRDAFSHLPARDEAFAAAERPGHWYADLYTLTAQSLTAAGVTTEFAAAPHCTLTEADLWYSHRRDGQCGRMASLIYLE